MAGFAVCYNDFLVRGFAVAPNPGYVQGVLTLNVVAISLIAVFLFGSELSLFKSVGVILTVIGVVILSVAK